MTDLHRPAAWRCGCWPTSIFLFGGIVVVRLDLQVGNVMRRHLLPVEQSSYELQPDGEGYNYCVACGRIETPVDSEVNLFQAHSRPYPTDEEGLCPGRVSSHVVLGTDFITDIALFSLPLDAPFQVRPGNDETASALRTICEAVAKAACRLLQIKSGEILAEYRPALTDAGAIGHEAEVFVHDTLAGGVGFSPQLAALGPSLFKQALKILASCPASCDTSCYRCLRSYRNKLEHMLLDRKLGEQLLRHALFGGYPDYPADRTQSSLDLLHADLGRHLSDRFRTSRNARRHTGSKEVTAPIVVTPNSGGAETWIDLSSPVAPDVPVGAELRALGSGTPGRLLCVDDLLVRRNLPAAVQQVQAAFIWSLDRCSNQRIQHAPSDCDDVLTLLQELELVARKEAHARHII
jgi:Domain of unknown function (DUF1998)